jgi:hypothetical protein
MDDRPFVVWDAQGRVLASFDTFDIAHDWAHQRAGEPGADLPLVIDDRRAGVSRRVWLTRCELVAWVEFAVLPGCDRQLRTAAPTTALAPQGPTVTTRHG